MEKQWAEDEKLEEILERRRMEGNSLQLEVMQEVPEVVVHERATKDQEVIRTQEKKRVKGWSTEEMKDKVNSLVEIDTEEMIKRRGLSQEEVNQCWKILAEQIEVLGKYKIEGSKREAFKGRGAPLEWRRDRSCKKYRIKQAERRLLGKNLRFVRRVQLAAAAKQARRSWRKNKRSSSSKD